MIGSFVFGALALASLPGFICVAPDGYSSVGVTASLKAGEAFQAPFGDKYFLALAPSEFGWGIEIHERGREENLARLTPPWHFVPNPRYLEGWHFRNTANTAPNDGSVNAPQKTREFYFSSEVGRTLDYDGAATPAKVVDAVRSFGRGKLRLIEYKLTPFAPGERAAFEELSFEACLVWRAPDTN